MEENDGAGLHAFGHALGDGGRVVVLPVQAVHIPLDRLDAHAAYRCDDVVVVLPKGRAEEGGGLPGDGGDLFSCGGQICHDLLGGERVEVGVGVRVTHHFMPRIGESLDRLRVFLHPVTHHKERGLDMVAAQNVDELLGILVAPGECYRAALGGQGIAARSKPGVIKE